ncbi:thioredoxin family protein [Robiginitalea sp.]|uniref:thioredoxin family protein n=1 Tax=Robiginitalea sp. TaxID=1902411 RepID=UPI003C728E96
MNRPYLLLLFMLVSGPAVGQFWHTDYKEAQSIAKAENKPILLVFQGSDWCAPCIKLDREVWTTEEFREYASSRWVMLKADFPRRSKNELATDQAKANAALAERYNKNGIFPFVVVLDKEGHVLGETSYQKIGPEGYINLIESYTKQL